MPRTRLLPSSDLRTSAFYGGANVRQMLFDPSGAPMTQARADRATQREVAETFAEVAGGRTLNMQIVYHYAPLDLWISCKWFSDVGDIQVPRPRVENYDFDEDAWNDARIDKVMINVA